ncbi:MAG: DNA repair protein RadC [Bacteroidales bacterium]|nr:DNA repair protein RadC [Bacteroidales bacterium]
METYDKKPSIRQWAEDERPREKLLLKGKSALSDAELLAILISSGNKEESAVDLCKRILSSVENNLVELSKLDVKSLSKFKGIGEAKALAIVAALELGRRRRAADSLQKPSISTSRDAYEIVQSLIGESQYEQFWILLLNRANKVIRKENISDGGITGTVADPKRIFKIAIDHSACYIILAHNHPSGNLRPSEDDIKLTRKIKQSGDLLDIKVLDHIIAGENNYYSFADEGLI